MSITVLQKEDIEADDILATLATQGAEQGYDVLVCSGDRDTIQLVNDDITLLYPNVQGVSQLKRYDTRRRHRALRRPARAVPRHRGAGRRDERQPARRPEGGREDRGEVARPVRLARRAARATPTRSPGVVGGNLREHLDDVRRNRTLNRLLRDVELPVDARRPRGAADGRAGGARHLRAPRVQDAHPARRRARRHRAADGRP